MTLADCVVFTIALGAPFSEGGGRSPSPVIRTPNVIRASVVPIIFQEVVFTVTGIPILKQAIASTLSEATPARRSKSVTTVTAARPPAVRISTSARGLVLASIQGWAA